MSFSALVFHLFLPYQTNNQRARLLHPVFVAFFIFVFLAAQVLVPLFLRFTPAVLGYAANIPPEKIIELTNEKRKEAGLSPLSLNQTLTSAALTKASDMLARDYWAHVAPDGREPWSFFIDSGYRYRFAGENLARDFAAPADVVSAWMASPTHRDNLLSTRYQDIGVAVIDGQLGGVETTLVVQFFGTKFTPGEIATSQTATTQPAPLVSLPKGTELGSVLSQRLPSQRALLSPFTLNKNLAIVLVSLFFAILALDLVIVQHRKIERRASRSLAHLLFFGMILGALFVIRAGSIL